MRQATLQPGSASDVAGLMGGFQAGGRVDRAHFGGELGLARAASSQDAPEAPADSKSHQVWRGQDHPHFVIICATYASREVAEAAFSDPAGLDAMAQADVEMSPLPVL